MNTQLEFTTIHRNNQAFSGSTKLSTFDRPECRFPRESWHSLKTADIGCVIVYEHSIEVKWEVPLSAPKYRPRGNRERIREFSANSRRWLYKTISRVNFRQLKDAQFVTLTYHNNFPTSAEVYKLHCKRFLEHLKKVFPDLAYFWKLEFQKRGAPHFHFMFFLPNFSSSELGSNFELAVHVAWQKFRGCDCIHCAAHSVKVEPMTSYRKATRYVAKYMAKTEEPLPDKFPGRFWGRSANLPVKPRTQIRIAYQEWQDIKELAIRLARSKGSKSANFVEHLRKNNSFWIMLDDDEELDFCFELWKILGRPWEYVPILVE